jgi:hypothetical protein
MSSLPTRSEPTPPPAASGQRAPSNYQIRRISAGNAHALSESHPARRANSPGASLIALRLAPRLPRRPRPAAQPPVHPGKALILSSQSKPQKR